VGGGGVWLWGGGVGGGWGKCVEGRGGNDTTGGERGGTNNIADRRGEGKKRVRCSTHEGGKGEEGPPLQKSDRTGGPLSSWGSFGEKEEPRNRQQSDGSEGRSRVALPNQRRESELA